MPDSDISKRVGFESILMDSVGTGFHGHPSRFRYLQLWPTWSPVSGVSSWRETMNEILQTRGVC